MVPNIQWTPIHNTKLRYGLFFCSILEFPQLISDKLFALSDSRQEWSAAALSLNSKFRGSYLQRLVLESYEGWLKKIQQEYVPEMRLEDTMRYYKYWLVSSSDDRMVDYNRVIAKNSPILSLPETFYPVYDMFVTKHVPYKVNSKTAHKFLIGKPTKPIKGLGCDS